MNLGTLISCHGDFGPGAEAKKALALAALAQTPLKSAARVRRLHDILCFLRAWPDSPELLARVEGMLESFSRRRDLRRFRGLLRGSGIEGTETAFGFYLETAAWLARRRPDRLAIDWPEFRNKEMLDALLPQLALEAEWPAVDSVALTPRQWLSRMRGPGEKDGAFLARRFSELPIPGPLRETLYERLDPPMRLLPGSGLPARTCEKLPRKGIAYQTAPLDRSRRLDLRPVRLREAGAAPAIDLARAAMAARNRDLDAFAHAEPRDVRVADCGSGVDVVVMGVRPDRRFLLETLYGYLLLKNGVLVGYGTGLSLFSSCEVAFNLFPEFRGGEAARLYGAVLRAMRALFACDTFVVDPYQIGQDNDEAIASGAWWFYSKLGFAPHDAATLRLARAEQGKAARRKGYRTPAKTLRALAEQPLFLHLGRRRRDVLQEVDLGEIGLAVTDFLARRFGSARAEGERVCVREASRLLGGRIASARWAPLVLALPGVGRWSPARRRALLALLRAKEGSRESDYSRLFDRHAALRAALLRLSRAGGR